MKGRYWFNVMPFELKQKWKKNVIDFGGEYEVIRLFNREFHNFGYFIALSFFWDNTDEGGEFWEKVGRNEYKLGFGIVHHLKEFNF